MRQGRRKVRETLVAPVESGGMRRAGGAVVVSFALALTPVRALDPCKVDFGLESGERSTGSVLAWDLPAIGKWRVSGRDAGRRVREVCGVGVIEAPLTAVRQVIEAAEDFDEFMPRVVESEVERVSPHVYLNSQVLDMPFPASDRHYPVRVETGVIETDAGAGWQARWNYVEGSGNVRSSDGSWTLIPNGPASTIVIYRLLTDPGGRLPAWVVGHAAPRTLRRALEAVRNRVLTGLNRRQPAR